MLSVLTIDAPLYNSDTWTCLFVVNGRSFKSTADIDIPSKSNWVVGVQEILNMKSMKSIKSMKSMNIYVRAKRGYIINCIFYL